MSVAILVIILSGIPFIVIQLMPGKKSFAFLAGLYTVLMAYGYYDIHKPLVNDLGDGPGAIFGMIFFYFLCYGAIAGIITRALTLYAASKNVSFTKRIGLTIAGTALIPCFLYGPTVLQKWKHRAPSAACNYDIVTFSVGGQKFKVPGIGIVTANTGDGKIGSRGMDDFFSFHGPSAFRKFCSKFNNGKTPASVNALNIDLSEIARERNDKRFEPLCTRSNWPDLICHYSEHRSPAGYPLKIGIYDKINFNSGYMGGGWDYKRIKDEMPRATKLSDIPGLAFDGRYYFWIDEGEGKNLNLPSALHCYKSNNALYCTSDEKLASNVYVSYSGLVSVENPVEDFHKIRKNMLDFLNSLKVAD